MPASLSHATPHEYDQLLAMGPQAIRLKPMTLYNFSARFHAITIEFPLHEWTWFGDGDHTTHAPYTILNFLRAIPRCAKSFTTVVNATTLSTCLHSQSFQAQQFWMALQALLC